MTTARQPQLSGSFHAVGATGSGVDSVAERYTAFSWDDWFRRASPQQRNEALGLAQKQGLLYPHQLPRNASNSNGAKPAVPAKETELSSLFVNLLSGKPATLPPITHHPISYFDNALDDLQKNAVSRAVHTPDLFLLQGLHGTGKSRVVTEIILQYAAHGRRVLFLAEHAESFDVVLERLVGRSEVFALRLLDAAEKVDSLPPWLRGFTLEEQKQAFLERVLSGARNNREQFETNCKRRSEQTALWDELRACADQTSVLDQTLRSLQARVPNIPDEVERDLSLPASTCNLVARVNELRDLKDRDLQEWEGELQKAHEGINQPLPENTARLRRIAELEAGYQAKKQSRVFSFAYWANLFNGTLIAEMERLQEEHAQANAFQLEGQKKIEQLQQRCQERRLRFEQERSAVIHAEIEERKRAVAGEVRALAGEIATLDERWENLCDRLNQHGLEKTPQAISAAQQVWLTHKKYDEQQCQFARQWTEFVETAGPQLAARLPSLANVIAGTTQRWNSDAKLQETVGAPFDLLILEDAESLTDADLQRLSRYASRCTLVRHLISETLPAAGALDKAILPHHAARTTATSWHRLWQSLGGDAWRGPYSWRRDHGRLVCQLLPLAQADYVHLETEGLADAPDIELRILHTPNATPRLAQVAFGSQTSFAEAFAFLMGEIQEFPLEALASTGWWDVGPNGLRLNFGHQPTSIETWVAVASGVQIGAVTGAPGETPRVACIVFDASAGWDRDKADAWLQRYRPCRDHGRTAFLQTPYRFTSQLAGILQSLVQTPDWQTTGAAALPRDAMPMEFIAVPMVANGEWPREGAGLELDLSTSRHADRLPVGLRQGLPNRGYVNYLEAQALIRRLETWLETESTVPRRIAVLALYQGQVELLRRLAQQSETLRSLAVPLEISLPSRMRQREWDVVFLSLTRSHGHRATAFGDACEELPIALTRACERLFVFGDPGTLNRRSQWTGPLDQLDPRAAQQELLHVKRLVACLRPAAPMAYANGKH